MISDRARHGARVGARVMDSDEIKRRIASFPRWHYEFDLKGHVTPVFSKAHVRRRHERRRYFFDPLVQLFGGSFEGKRVLDLGCNAGFWSLCAIEAGCDFVLGIDGRQMYIDQANYVFEVKEVERDRYHFAVANIFDLNLADFGSFDIVLCLGLLYHVSKPMDLMEKMAEVNSDIVVVDTLLSSSRGSYLELLHEPLEEPLTAVDYELVMYPTRQAVIDMARQFGYSVVVLKPQFQSYRNAWDYRLGFRRAFLCARKTDLAKAPLKVEPLRAMTPSAFVPTRLARKVVRFLRKGRTKE